MESSSLLQQIQNRLIEVDDPLFEQIHAVQRDGERLLHRLNQQLLSPKAFRDTLAELIGQPIDESVVVLPPFYTDFGQHISLGKDIFINRGVMLTDLGSIQIDDHVLIGPFAKLLTVNHPVSPAKRRGLLVAPIRLKQNAWIGAGATILPGVTIGEHAIVAANATVTKDVPDKAIVAGTPARIIRYVDETEG
ncbi:MULTISPECIES: DapH/DapD/GlmU-related protein [Exiguobacterium]|uniref:DapH/DapD/GlmU-related protein n=1 Tax=Exiguobacterium TaxID=33986 RepID=UPI001AE6AE2E|nr:MULTISPECIES: DapH/DapD/GlmU-related protein [Exiguobacterium]MCT4779966.1 sugar O-acetyltransferase [Exiguobacterium soli]